MNVDEIKAKTARLRELLAAEPERDPVVKEVVDIGLDLLEGFLINQSNTTYFLEELQVMEMQKRSQ